MDRSFKKIESSPPMIKPISIIQGGQFGSEAKGAIAAYLCEKDGVDYNVRTGATNAGHTCYYKGKPYAMQQLGVGWVNPDTTLVVGAGALIDPTILEREVAMVSEATGEDIKHRLFIDHRAGLHLPVHQQRSADSGRHVKIGATGKGCSEALIDRIRGRGEGNLMFGTSAWAKDFNTGDTEQMLNNAWDQGARIQLEGTQGQGLDLYLGPYPYVTHKQTGPAQWMLECGLSPSLPNEITLVIRTFPIRVAGDSGPMRRETSWLQLAGQINAKRRASGFDPIVAEESLEVWSTALDVAGREFPIPDGKSPHDQHTWGKHDRADYNGTLSQLNAAAWSMVPAPIQADLRKLFELTTVTKKLRRIAEFDTIQFNETCRQVRPRHVAVTFANYLWPKHWFDTTGVPNGSPIGPADLISYGPESKHVVDRRNG